MTWDLFQFGLQPYLFKHHPILLGPYFNIGTNATWPCAVHKIFINDCLDWVNCYVGLFTDDNLTTQQMKKRYQTNLKSLNTRAKTLGMSFNAKKCKVVAVHPQILNIPDYTMGNEVLDNTEYCKYLGVRLEVHQQHRRPNQQCVKNK